MSPHTLKIERVGQIEEANVRFGDLTVLVGPQASGKSIFLQFLKLLVDTGSVLDFLRRYGLDWDKRLPGFLDIYLGEGMGKIWREAQSCVTWNGKPVDLESLVRRQRRKKQESAFYIPAQRVLTLNRGWPRPFGEYSQGDPFCVRDFSEKLRLQMESELGQGEKIFPRLKKLKAEIRKGLDANVFCGFGLRVDTHGAQKRLVLSVPDSKESLPFMVWSAGQREFVPLLLGLYWLMPPTRSPRRAGIEWVIIEEPEMGLHPKAISSVLLLVLDLLARGYRICLSTHSPHVLDVVWALRVFRERQAEPRRLLELFEVESTPPMKEMAQKALTKDARVYLFDGKPGRTHEISKLDPGSDDRAESGWGGLSEFSGHVADVVASVVGDTGP